MQEKRRSAKLWSLLQWHVEKEQDWVEKMSRRMGPFILRFSDTKLCLKRHVYLYHSFYWTLQFQRLQLLNGYRFND